MGMAVARYVHTLVCTVFVEYVCMIFRQSARYKEEQSYA